MTLVLISGLIGIVLWLLIANRHNNLSASRPKIHVPNWLAFIIGSKSNHVDIGLLALQIIILLFVVWTVFVTVMIAPGEYRGTVWRFGCLLSFLLVSVLTIILALFTKSRRSDL